MAGRNHEDFARRALAAVADAARGAGEAPSLETALSALSRAAYDLLGDREAHLRPGGLKAGERQFLSTGFFVVAAERDAHVIVAEQGFPAEQHRARVPIDLGHPGVVYRTRERLILSNTDEHPDFRQILKTARMGSAVYAPVLVRTEMVAQLVMAAQARGTFEPLDLDVLCALAHLAALAWVAHDGSAFVRGLAGPGR